MSNLSKKILELQNSIDAKKNEPNSFSNFDYWSANSLIKDIQPKASSLSLMLKFLDTMENIGNRYYAKSELIVTDVDTEETDHAYGWAREEEARPKFDAPQLTGSAFSYARKRALEALFALSSEKDSDSTNDELSSLQAVSINNYDISFTGKLGQCSNCAQFKVSEKSMRWYRDHNKNPLCFECSKLNK